MSFELRPYQADCVRAILADHAGGAQSTLSVLPTGSGKTEVFIRLSQEWAHQHPQGLVLLVSHLSLLTSQTRDRYQLRAPEMLVGIHQAHQHPNLASRVVISTMQTLRSPDHQDWLKRMMLRQPSLIIVDEAHTIPTPSYEHIRAAFATVPLAGFTATPFYNRQTMLTCFDKLSYTISLQELINQGYLVPPRLYSIERRSDDLADQIALVLSIYRDREAGKQAIVYMQSINDARLMAAAFEEIGVAAHPVTQDLTGSNRDTILSAFDSGRTKVLTTVNVLTAGFDSPHVECIIMPYGTDSPTTYVQRIGRGLRPNPSRNKTECSVYVFGPAPSIARKAYERLTNQLLNADGRDRAYDTYREDLEMNAPGTETHLWTQIVVKAIQRMEKLGMDHFATMLNSKTFPEKFLRNMHGLLANLPTTRSSRQQSPKSITESQSAFLFKQGFGSHQLTGLTKSEASIMISAIVNAGAQRSPSQQKWSVTEGQHKGKHVCELPFSYRNIVKARYPDSQVALLIRQWEQERTK